MSDIRYCPNDDCDHVLTDCGDVWHCPRCDERFTHAILAAHQDLLDAGAELWEFRRLA